MCLLAIGFQTLPDCPAFIFANREELFGRPAIPPERHPACAGMPAWLGGIDRQAGGTWLGINAERVLVAVTNRRHVGAPAQPVSRGLLCRALLACGDATAARDVAVRYLSQNRFAGCNLLLLDSNRGCILEWVGELRATDLTPGWHFVTNGAPDDPLDGRVQRVRGRIDSLRGAVLPEWINAAQSICGLRASGKEPAVCLEGTDRGTVSSTIVALDADVDRAAFWHADGPPTTTPYRDFSAELRNLLQTGHAGRPGHRIALAGPWQSDLAGGSTIQFPLSRSDFAEIFGGRVRLTRRFNRPTNLDGDRALITFNQVPGCGHAFLNGEWLGGLSALENCQCFDATEVLQLHNVLELELDCSDHFDPAAVAEDPCLSVAVEIRESQ